MWNPFRRWQAAVREWREAKDTELALAAEALMIEAYKLRGVDVEAVTLQGGKRLIVHAKEKCAGEKCCIHNPSEHHMREWPQNWRADTRVMERICPHNIGHPDPDEINPDKRHCCDTCCIVLSEPSVGEMIKDEQI